MLANMGWPRWLAQRVALNGRGASGPAIRLRRLFPLPYVPYLFHDAALRIEMEERRMSVMIRGQDRTRLKVMGDVDAELVVPADSAGRCWLSFSDGTLIEAAYGEAEDCRFAVSEEGARIERIQREGDSDVLRLDWRVEWVTVAGAGNAARATARGEPMPVLPGLFG